MPTVRMHSAHERLDKWRPLAARAPFIVIGKQKRRRDASSEKVSLLPAIKVWIATRYDCDFVEVAFEKISKLAIGT